MSGLYKPAATSMTMQLRAQYSTTGSLLFSALRGDTKALTSIVVACLVECAQRRNQVGFRRRRRETTALIFSGQNVQR